MTTYNVMGPADAVSKLMQHGFRACDVFPCAPDRRDVNVEVDMRDEDRFTDLCAEYGLDCEMV